MGDEQVGQAGLCLQIGQQVQNLGLDRHVQCRDRLVTDHELGTQGKTAGNADTLALAAGELVGIPVEHIGGQAAFFHDLEDVFLHGRIILLEDAMGDQAFGR